MYIDRDIYPGVILDSNWSMVLEHSRDKSEIVGFISLSSAFYPDRSDYYDLLAREWIQNNLDEEEL